MPAADPLAAAGAETLMGSMPGLITSFQGISNPDGYFPPDPSGAVGPDHFVQMVNVSTQIFDKQGNLLFGPFHPSDLWPPGDPCHFKDSGDVVVLYDQMADRWLLTQFGVQNWPNGKNFYECIAVSKGPVPTDLPADWYPYTFLVHITKMNDYPKLGIWPDGYYMTANQFEVYTWAGVGIWVFERDKMLLGQAATFQYQDLLEIGLDLASVLPANLLGYQQPPAGAPNYAVTVDDGLFTGGTPLLTVLETAARWPGGMSVTVADELPVAPFSWMAVDIPQKNTSIRLDAISDRLMMHAYYRNMGSYETMTANHTVDAGGGRAGIRWYELRKNSGETHWQVYQQGTYAPPDGVHRWMGSLAMDRHGNLALGYSVSGSDLYPGIRYAGRMASDPLGTLPQAEMVMIDGAGHQLRTQDGIGRWGDYSAMSLDPVDDCTFWYTNEYMPVSGDQPWSTWIGAFKFPGCIPGLGGTLTGQVTDASSGEPVAGASLQGAGALPSLFFQTTSGPGGVYSVQIPESVYTMTVSAFSYSTQKITGIAVTGGLTTTLNVALQPAPAHAVSGVVRDGNTGWPLYARIDIEGYPGAPLWTDPQTGGFSIILPEFVTYTLHVSAFSPGYFDTSLPIGQVTSPQDLAIELFPDLDLCTAPGYEFDLIGCQHKQGGLAVGNVTDANTLDGLNGASVQIEGGEAVLAVATPDDPAVGEGFYTLFVPVGPQAVQAAHSQYVTQSAILSIPAGEAVRQDFALPAGRLVALPVELSASAGLDASVTLHVTLTNTGSAALQFTITESNPVFAPVKMAFRRSFNPRQDNTDSNTFFRQTVTPASKGAELQQVDFTALTGHTCLLGVEFALGSYWLTSGGESSCGDSNALIQVSPAGEVLNTYAQPDQTSEFGWRDLAFDGVYLYASHSSLIQQISPLTGQLTGLTIPAPVNPVRALAYDPASEHFWVANQASGIYEIDRQGSIVRSLPSLLNVYGLAYDPGAPGGPALWAWSQDGSPPVLANRIDPQTGQILASFGGAAQSNLDQAGGAAFTDTLIPGKRVLLALHQEAADRVVAYDLGPAYQTDLPWLTPEPAAGSIGPGDTLPIIVTLQSSQAGIFRAELLIANDTPYGTLTIPVTFAVNSYSYLPFISKSSP